jgi:ribosomal protein L14
VYRPTRAVCALAVVLVLAAVAPAENPQVAALNNELKVLRAQRDATVKAVKAQYETLIKRGKVTEAVLVAERKALARQEETLLALAQTEADRDAVRLRYDTLRGYLKAETKLDAAVIRQLRAMENTHLDVIKNAYNGKIKTLEAAVKAAKAKK